MGAEDCRDVPSLPSTEEEMWNQWAIDQTPGRGTAGHSSVYADQEPITGFLQILLLNCFIDFFSTVKLF